MLVPLVLGGTLDPVRPFGPQLGLSVGLERTIVDDDTRTQVEAARIRVARTVAPVDVLPPISPAEWAMAAALNDLLQVSNHHLSSMVTRGNHTRLLDAVLELCNHIPPARTLEEAVARHGTFANIGVLRRTDTTVQLWSGRANFRGAPVKKDDFVWPHLRRVTLQPRHVTIRELAKDVAVDAATYQRAYAAILALTPITQLSEAVRATAAFSWTSSSLSLVAARGGAAIAVNAIQAGCGGLPDAHTSALQTFTAASELLSGAMRPSALRFVTALKHATAS